MSDNQPPSGRGQKEEGNQQSEAKKCQYAADHCSYYEIANLSYEVRYAT